MRVVKAVKRYGRRLLRSEHAARVTFGVVTKMGDVVLVLHGVGGVEVVAGVLVCSEERHGQTTQV